MKHRRRELHPNLLPLRPLRFAHSALIHAYKATETATPKTPTQYQRPPATPSNAHPLRKKKEGRLYRKISHASNNNNNRLRAHLPIPLPPPPHIQQLPHHALPNPRIPLLQLPQLLRRSPQPRKHTLHPDLPIRLPNILPRQRFAPLPQLSEMLRLRLLLPGRAVRVIQCLRTQDVASELLAEAVHAAFFGGLARGEGGVGGAAGDDGDDGWGGGGSGELVWREGFGAVGCAGGGGEGVGVDF